MKIRPFFMNAATRPVVFTDRRKYCAPDGFAVGRVYCLKNFCINISMEVEKIV